MRVTYVVDGASYPSFTEDTVFGDSGSSCHIRNTMEVMFDIETTNKQIDGVGNNIRATRKGKLKAEVVQADGSKTTKILSSFKYILQRRKKNCYLLLQK